MIKSQYEPFDVHSKKILLALLKDDTLTFYLITTRAKFERRDSAASKGDDVNFPIKGRIICYRCPTQFWSTLQTFLEFATHKLKNVEII